MKTGLTLGSAAPITFAKPEQLPSDSQEARQWQDANRSFWEKHPMRYDWNKEVGHEPFTVSFYKEIDMRFFSNAHEYMPWRKIPFDALISFDGLKQKNVLEIGVGSGSHAQLLATHSGSFTGIDLTRYAVKSTSERFRLFDIPGNIFQMDAEKMSFADSIFDFVWSWGVIHHSSDTQKIVGEIFRVLKPGGEATLMVYHRGWWNYYILHGLLHGIVLGDLFRSWSLSKAVQNSTDGAIARYYTLASWHSLIQGAGLKVKNASVKGQKSDLFPLPQGKLKSSLMRIVPDRFTRFLTNQCRMGQFLISTIVKPREDVAG
jgi:ubiquinone/menaquinone biosynthesis C-methylase UbiE